MVKIFSICTSTCSTNSSNVETQLDSRKTTTRCPITQEVMKDPVIAQDGFTYERREIEKWYRETPPGRNPISPMTGAAITNRKLVPNEKLKKFIDSVSSLNLSEDKIRELIEEIKKEQEERINQSICK